MEKTKQVRIKKDAASAFIQESRKLFPDRSLPKAHQRFYEMLTKLEGRTLDVVKVHGNQAILRLPKDLIITTEMHTVTLIKVDKKFTTSPK